MPPKKKTPTSRPKEDAELKEPVVKAKYEDLNDVIDKELIKRETGS